MSARLYAHVVGVQVRKLLAYRVDFWTGALVTFFVELGLAYYLWTAVFRETGRQEIAGFSLDAMIVYYVTAILLGRLVKGNERDRSISEDIYEGSLNRYLLYPSNYFVFKYAEHVGSLTPALVELVLFGAAAVLVLPAPPDVHVTPASIAMAAGSVLVSNILHFTMMFPLRAAAFWADHTWTLEVMYRFISQMLGGLMLPLTLFPDWARPMLDVLPFKYLYYVPAMTLLGHVPPAEWALGIVISLAWSVAIGLVARVVWRRGTYQYAGVGI